MVRSFADWGSERYLPKVIKSGIGPPVHILIFDFLRPSSRTPVLSSDPEAEWTTRQGVSKHWTGFSTGIWDWNVGLDY